ncbi:hypothetical protein KKA39_02285, partial [Patescibacteria group bacterium]|nr:hypothetical protein [Patescibacteria group bacterium]
MKLIKHIFKNHLSAVLAIGFLVVFVTTFNLLAAPDPYDPGETLDPTCNPGEAGCTVEIPTGWDLTGTSGTVDGTNFIGTTDDVPLNFKVNNEKSGRI